MAVHASDLLPTFWNTYIHYAKSLPACFDVSEADAIVIALALKYFAPSYQSYFASHAVTGDPNTNAIKRAKAYHWRPASVNAAGSLTNVVDAHLSFFNDTTDSTNSASNCDFWKGIAAAIQPASGDGENLALMVQDTSVRGSNEL